MSGVDGGPPTPVHPEVVKILNEVRVMLGVPALRLVPSVCTGETHLALALLRKLTPEERALVLSWFCPACFAYVGRGERHDCPAGAPPEGP